MINLFIYRNCYSGGVSGGDTHMDGIINWVSDRHPNVDPYLIFAKNDGQERVYEAARRIKKINYPAPQKLSFAILFIIRAILGTILVKLPPSIEGNILIASSHFLPDVLPVYVKSKRKDTTSVVYIHHIIQEMPRPRNLNTFLANIQEKLCFQLIRKRFNKIIVVNEHTKLSLIERGFTNQDILVSSNFVDTDSSKLVKDYHEKEFTIAYCGRMVPQKGIDVFIRICEDLSKITPSFNAVMIGTGPEFNRIQSLVKQKNLPVTLTGFAEEARKLQTLRTSGLFIFPSVEEGWGITIAESLAAGTPVLAYDLSVYKPIFGDHIHTVKLGREETFLKMARNLLDQFSRSPKGYKQEQDKITRFAQRFSLKTVAEKEVSFILEV